MLITWPSASLAADHFLTRGYRNFGYFGSGLAHYSQLRLASFREAVEQAGFEVHACHVEYLPRLSGASQLEERQCAGPAWLRELAKPVAVLADHDVPAHDLADMCQLLGLRVPDDVAILGVDDDELECQLAFPPLSSVAIPAEQIGFEAARLLGPHALGQPGVERGPSTCRRSTLSRAIPPACSPSTSRSSPRPCTTSAITSRNRGSVEMSRIMAAIVLAGIRRRRLCSLDASVARRDGRDGVSVARAA